MINRQCPINIILKHILHFIADSFFLASLMSEWFLLQYLHSLFIILDICPRFLLCSYYESYKSISLGYNTLYGNSINLILIIRVGEQTDKNRWEILVKTKNSTFALLIYLYIVNPWCRTWCLCLLSVFCYFNLLLQ